MIGNYVLYASMWQQVYSIGETAINIAQEPLKLNMVSPILLSEEILLKCGFVDGRIDNENFSLYVIFYDGWHVSFKENQGYGSTEYQSVGDINFLHELQNLLTVLGYPITIII